MIYRDMEFLLSPMPIHMLIIVLLNPNDKGSAGINHDNINDSEGRYSYIQEYLCVSV